MSDFPWPLVLGVNSLGVILLTLGLCALHRRRALRRLDAASQLALSSLGPDSSRNLSTGQALLLAEQCLERLRSELGGARQREVDLQAEQHVLAAAVSDLIEQLQAAARGAESLFGGVREVSHSMSQSYRHVSAAASELSAVVADSSVVTSRAAACQEKEALTAEGIANSSREIGRSLIRQIEMGERIRGLTGTSREILEKARSSSSKLGSRTAEALRRGSEVPAIGQRLAKTGEDLRAIVDDLEKEAVALVSAGLHAGETLEEMRKRSDELGSIIEFLGNVAEETNLLALNAAIIAAEAGPEGRGFCVVADEIRELSERMASSTREMGSLTETTRQGVREAESIVRKGSERSAGARKIAQRAVGTLEGLLRDAGAVARFASEMSGTVGGPGAGSDDLDETLSGAASATEDLARCRDELCHEQERMRRLLGSLLEAAQGASALVMEQSRVTAELAGKITRMHDLALPLQRAADEHHAHEEHAQERLARLEGWLQEMRGQIGEFERRAGASLPATAAGRDRSPARPSPAPGESPEDTRRAELPLAAAGVGPDEARR